MTGWFQENGFETPCFYELKASSYKSNFSLHCNSKNTVEQFSHIFMVKLTHRWLLRSFREPSLSRLMIAAAS
ncbi:hypothetical protein T4B_8839 [Trichinella pseudospiralis]|uniref:Uncharacterized protein n=1 Tax=Trichinella pseudospiralis TaxID=6337 RepID=A0A0V1IJG8_TRIPS|nr:hypothetical protein T4B_8839 [Trichinella pseudospiralis]